jgi:hypothetical protein
MQKILVLFFLFCFISCDFMIKDSFKEESVLLNTVVRDQVINDTNENGCDLKSGYKYSNLEKKCIRVFELGYRITSVEKDTLGNNQNAYFFITDDSLRTEIFFPDSKESIIFKRNSKDENFTYDDFTFDIKKGFKLTYKNTLLFAPATPKDIKVLGKDEEQ